MDERSRIGVWNGKNKRANSDGLLISKTKKAGLIQNIKERERILCTRWERQVRCKHVVATHAFNQSQFPSSCPVWWIGAAVGGENSTVGGRPAVNIGRAPTFCRQLYIETSYAVFLRTVFYVSRNVDYFNTSTFVIS